MQDAYFFLLQSRLVIRITGTNNITCRRSADAGILPVPAGTADDPLICKDHFDFLPVL